MLDSRVCATKRDVTLQHKQGDIGEDETERELTRHESGAMPSPPGGVTTAAVSLLQDLGQVKT